MKVVEWSAKAEWQLDRWIDYLKSVSSAELARRATDEVRGKADGLARFSGYRESWWPGYQQLSLGDWHKLLIYRVDGDRVIIRALYDMRQDLSRVKP